MTHTATAQTSARSTPRLTHVRASAAIPGISQAVIIEHGRIAYLSGLVPLAATGEVPESFGDQLTQVFAHLHAALADLGATASDLVRITIYVVGLSEDKLPQIRAARDQFLTNSDAPPASALLGVAALFHPDVQVEVDAIVSLRS